MISEEELRYLVSNVISNLGMNKYQDVLEKVREEAISRTYHIRIIVDEIEQALCGLHGTELRYAYFPTGIECEDCKRLRDS